MHAPLSRHEGPTMNETNALSDFVNSRSIANLPPEIARCTCLLMLNLASRPFAWRCCIDCEAGKLCRSDLAAAVTWLS